MNADPRNSLKELACRASRYSINLDGRVTIDMNFVLRGAYAFVRQGTLHPGKTKVAVKTARGGPPGDLETIKRSLQEVHVLSKLSHRNVLPLLGITTEFDMTVSIVSQWMGRGNAHDYVQDKAIDPRPLIEGIAQGLHYLHTHRGGPIIHGDLKGLNVLISDDGEALLSDFGHAFLSSSTFSLSTSGHIGSTINWMAPELLDGGVASERSDVWAFGMTALELFTRKDPFHDRRGVTAILLCIIRGPPHRPSDSNTSSRMTDEWWDLLTLCWEFNTSRPPMSYIVERIKHIMNESYSVSCSVDPSRALEALVQQVLGQYPDINLDQRVDREDGPIVRGTYSSVQRGILRPEGMKVAIKTACRSTPGDENTIVSILKEILVWTKLRHNNLLPLLGITTKFNLTLSIVSQWMERGDAHQYVQDRAIDPCPLIEGVARGLAYLHDHTPNAIIHGDVKGSNVLISDDGGPLLSDFGFSSFENSSLSTMAADTNNSGDMVNWMALEVLGGGGATTQSDVWSFGMTALELFTCRIPFSGSSNIPATMIRIIRGPPDRPGDKQTCFRMTDEWWELCSSCWHRIPSVRPTMSHVVERISSIMDPSHTASYGFISVSGDVSRRCLYSTHNGGDDVDDNPSLAVTLSNNQEDVIAVRIFTSEEEPLASPMEVVLTLVPEVHSFRVHSPIVWQILQFPARSQTKYMVDIPTVMGITTTEMDDDVVYCDIKTTAKMRHIFTFNRSRTWEQHHAADFPPDVVGIANHCGIPKSFAIYAATGEFGARPLLYTGSIRSGDTIMLGWPVVLQAYDVTHHHHKIGQLLSYDVKTARLFPNEGLNTKVIQNNVAFELLTSHGQHVLEPVQVSPWLHIQTASRKSIDGHVVT